ncbi:hypothetical protein CERSUDRAFT_92346 [Gelatoporia subvermispora B]|uniref:Transmembrane protein n=1 Tax=Ceriporiopsis subvermispora (strain B) TaxID=914234 RepID=M2PT37_CERS8|nr:hypothetical protein CERSUDRAFT_92346 [Gelatoporia subvermispora B]
MSTRQSLLSNLSTASLMRGTLSPSRQAYSSGTKFGGKKQKLKELTLVKATRAGVIPLAPEFIVGIAITLSVIFIASVLFVFLGADYDESTIQKRLDSVATENPGLVLIGDNVDVDIDEPSVGFRWSVIGCGESFVLPGSEGIHDSSLCGLPAMALDIFVDNEVRPGIMYNPTHFPTINGSKQRLNVDNLYQFDSDHVLDVHEQRLYPFDTYRLISTLRAQTPVTNESLPIRGIWTISEVSSFSIDNTDTASWITVPNGTHAPSRDISVTIRRPGNTRAITMFLFITSWMLAHATLGIALLAWSVEDRERLIRHFESVFVIILVIPKLRDAMPDAPGYDGVLLDTVGFFPQMILAAMAAVGLLLMLATRELQGAEQHPTVITPVYDDRPHAVGQLKSGMRRLRQAVTSVDFSKHLHNISRSVNIGNRSRRHDGPGSTTWEYEKLENNKDHSDRRESGSTQGRQSERSSLASSRGYIKKKHRLASIRDPKQVEMLYSEWVV